jgi:hypothetical protein
MSVRLFVHIQLATLWADFKNFIFEDISKPVEKIQVPLNSEVNNA